MTDIILRGGICDGQRTKTIGGNELRVSHIPAPSIRAKASDPVPSVSVGLYRSTGETDQAGAIVNEWQGWEHRS